MEQGLFIFFMNEDLWVFLHNPSCTAPSACPHVSQPPTLEGSRSLMIYCLPLRLRALCFIYYLTCIHRAHFNSAASILLFYKSMPCLCLYQSHHLKLSICLYLSLLITLSTAPPSCPWHRPLRLSHFPHSEWRQLLLTCPTAIRAKLPQHFVHNPLDTHLSAAPTCLEWAHFLHLTRPPQAMGATHTQQSQEGRSGQNSRREGLQMMTNDLCFHKAQKVLSEPLLNLVYPMATLILKCWATDLASGD